MKPLGSITKYWQFVDMPLQIMMQSEMDSALNYVNFVESFFNRVLEDDCDEVTVFLACIMGQNIVDYERIDAMARKFPSYILVRPYFLSSLQERRDDIPIKAIIESIQEALSLNSNPWIELELRMDLLATSMQIVKETHLRDEASRRIEALFQENKDLECFKPKYYTWFVRSAESFQEIIDIAKKYDDQWALSSVYSTAAWVFRDSDVKKAREYFDMGLKLTEINGGNPRNEGLLVGKAGLYNVCGEFDASIECYLDIIEKKQKGHSFQSLRYIPLNLARVHHTACNYEEALEWARLGIDEPNFISSWGMPRMAAHFRMALALASMRQFDEAEEHFGIAQKMALDSASEFEYADEQYVLGIIEFNRGNIEYAIECLEEAYRLFESYKSRIHMNYALRHLAECEVALHLVGSSEVGSTKWLQLLEETSRDRGFPGYLGIALVLKTELRVKQGLIEEAKECLSAALQISRRPETRFLQNMIATLLNKTKLSPAFDT